MKRLIAVLLTLGMVLSFAACGSKQTAAPDDKSKPFAGENLTVLYMSGVYADAARAMVADFEEATGAKVEVVDYPYLSLHEKALLDLSSGTGSYDVIDVSSNWDGEFAPFLEPLDPYVERDNYDMGVWIPNVLANCGGWQGTTIGIPNACTPSVFAYRTDLLPDGIPDTWEAYREELKRVKLTVSTVSPSPSSAVSWVELLTMFSGLWAAAGPTKTGT